MLIPPSKSWLWRPFILSLSRIREVHHTVCFCSFVCFAFVWRSKQRDGSRHSYSCESSYHKDLLVSFLFLLQNANHPVGLRATHQSPSGPGRSPHRADPVHLRTGVPAQPGHFLSRISSLMENWRMLCHMSNLILFRGNKTLLSCQSVSSTHSRYCTSNCRTLLTLQWNCQILKRSGLNILKTHFLNPDDSSRILFFLKKPRAGKVLRFL